MLPFWDRIGKSKLSALKEIVFLQRLLLSYCIMLYTGRLERLPALMVTQITDPLTISQIREYGIKRISNQIQKEPIL